MRLRTDRSSSSSARSPIGSENTAPSRSRACLPPCWWRCAERHRRCRNSRWRGLATGAVAGWVIPVSMAYLGDVTPPDRLQPILARYASGYILGQLFGQATGGVLGDLFGWRNVFFTLGGMFALAAAGLIFELIVNPQTRAARPPRRRPARLRRRLCRGPFQSLRAHHSDHGASSKRPWRGARLPISAQICTCASA